MSAMLARHRLEDGVCLAVTPSTEDDRFVGPFHCGCEFLAVRRAPSFTVDLAEAEGGIAVEESLGSKPNRELGIRHHRIILGAGNMGFPERIPGDDVGVID